MVYHHSIKVYFVFEVSVYTIGLLGLFGCLPKYLGNQCLDNGKCEAFVVTGQSAASESPFEISRDDIAIETRITNFQLTDRALLAETEVRETCRALHLATKSYVLTQEKWYHKPFKGYTLEEPIFVNGQYEPCSDWKVDQTIELAVKYKNVDGAPFNYPLQRTQSAIQLPFTALGIGMLSNPVTPQVTVQVLDTPKKELLQITLPERNGDWVCEVIPTIDRIVSKGTYDTWKININIGDSIVPLDYIYETEPRLLFYKSAIDECSASERAYLQGIIRASANENPKSYGHLNYLYSELFGKKLTGVKRPRGQSSGTAKKTTKRRGGSIVGTYQCKHNGQMAYMRIYRNGVFSLKLELEAGSAQGLCKDNSCTIESINSNAVAFTNNVNSFTVKRSGNALVINGDVRCDKKS